MKSIAEVSAEIEHEFSVYDDWMDRYNYLIELGRSCPMIDERYKDESHTIKGCQSRVWLHADLQEGLLVFTADSDAVITKGIASLLIRLFNHQTPEAVLAASLEVIDAIGLREHLSPTRSNGLTSMIKQIKMYALAFQLKQKGQGA